jgi:hypothetical protein
VLGHTCIPPCLPYSIIHCNINICLFLNNKEASKSIWTHLICSKLQTLHHATYWTRVF